MSTSDAADFAAAASALFAAFGLFYAGRQTAQNRRSVDLSTLQAFVAESRALWRECMDCLENPVKFRFCLGQILGHFDLFALHIAHNSPPSNVCEYIEETIIGYLDEMAENDYGPHVLDLTGGPHVCKGLKDFVLQRRPLFRHYREVTAMLHIPRSSL